MPPYPSGRRLDAARLAGGLTTAAHAWVSEKGRERQDPSALGAALDVHVCLSRGIETPPGSLGRHRRRIDAALFQQTPERVSQSNRYAVDRTESAGRDSAVARPGGTNGSAGRIGTRSQGLAVGTDVTRTNLAPANYATPRVQVRGEARVCSPVILIRIGRRVVERGETCCTLVRSTGIRLCESDRLLPKLRSRPRNETLAALLGCAVKAGIEWPANGSLYAMHIVLHRRRFVKSAFGVFLLCCK